ncbi:MAG: class I SAM-dependent methyltransferase [Elusimicrobiota bacterium]
METKCYLCGGRTEKLFEKEKADYARCTICGLMFVSSGTGDIENRYREKDSGRQGNLLGSECDRMIKRMKYRLSIVGRYTDATPNKVRQNKGRLLDIGSSRGDFVKVASDAGWDCTAVELSKRDCDYIRNELKIKAVDKDLTEINFPDEYFDAITLWHVFEHFSDPLKELKEIYRILCKDGVLCLEVPNIDSPVYRLKGKNWKYINNEHLYYYNKKTIKMISEAAGFGIEYITDISGLNWWGEHATVKVVLHGVARKLSLGDHIVAVLKK